MKKGLIKINGVYGARIGGHIVSTYEAAESYYKTALDMIYRKEGLSVSGAKFLDEVQEALVSMGYTWEELEEIENSFLETLETA